MFDGTPDMLARLIEPGRVHRSVYTDPDIFELEMERIFGRTWIFVGHDSQIPNGGLHHNRYRPPPGDPDPSP